MRSIPVQKTSAQGISDMIDSNQSTKTYGEKFNEVFFMIRQIEAVAEMGAKTHFELHTPDGCGETPEGRQFARLIHSNQHIYELIQDRCATICTILDEMDMPKKGDLG